MTRFPSLCVPFVILCLSARAAAPWWDDFPRIVQTHDPAQARSLHASAVLCGAAIDPTWGAFGQRLSWRSSRGRIARIHAAGMKAMTWFEAFGTCMGYVAQLKKSAGGGWVKYPDAPSLTRVFAQHWCWTRYDGTGVIRWISAANYFDDADFARPYTLRHPRYGCPAMRYPDGRIAADSAGFDADPRRSRVFDAGCSKDVFGRLSIEYGFNAKVNAVDPATGKPRGPLKRLLKVGGRYAGSFNIGKDSACPIWIDYARASVRQALDAGVDGLWCDNFSAWDSFGARPIGRAFGEWSTATFRRYLAAHFSAAELRRMGVEDARTFDVRAYLRAKARRWGARMDRYEGAALRDPFDSSGAALRDRAWRGPRWLDDPIWRAYLIHKRQAGARALETYYRALKETAKAAGKPDLLVAGNDIPVMSLGWVRGWLDMVSTELAWGWGLASSKRGFMPPPRGSYVPLYKLAREHAKSRFVNVWMYVPKAQHHKPHIARVLYYQALANHALPMPYPRSPRTVGDEAAAAEFFGFVQSAAAAFSRRRRIERIGLYFSSSSQLMTFAPGGFVDFNRQPHVFAHWGWGEALWRLHYQYRAVPEWKLNAETLRGLRLLIIPNAAVFPPEDVPVLTRGVKAGGSLIITCESGARTGERGNFGRLARSSLTPLIGEERREGLRRVGAGRVLYLPQPIGLDFFLADAERRQALLLFRRAIRTAAPEKGTFVFPDASGVPDTVGLTAYADETAGRFFIDINNIDIDAATDQLTPAPKLRFTVALPAFLAGKAFRVRVLTPQPGLRVSAARTTEKTVRVEAGALKFYASVVLERARAQ